MKYRRTFTSLLLFGLVSFALLACSSSTTNQEQPTTSGQASQTAQQPEVALPQTAAVYVDETGQQAGEQTSPTTVAQEADTAQPATDIEAATELTTAEIFADTTPPTIVSTSVDGGAFIESFSTITAIFSEAMNDPAGDTGTDDVTNPDNYLLVAWDENEVFDTQSCQTGVRGDDFQITINSVTYDSATYTVTLTINNGDNLLNSKYHLHFCGTTTLQDTAGNALNGGKDTIKSFLVSTKSPEVKSTTLEGSPFASFSKFTVTFSEDMYNPDGNYDKNDITNPLNYRLIEAGANGIRNTHNCEETLGADDVEITLDALIDPEVPIYSITYNSDTFTTTIFANGGAYLPNGKYRFMVCGEGEYQVTDMHMNPLNAGADYTIDFVINSNVTDTLPTTGFEPGTVTVLGPMSGEYSLTTADIWIEIPSIGVQADIFGVPQKDSGGWDVQWLGDTVGWLEGSAFPLWEGNSVLTGHSVNANGLPGVFANLSNLQYGDVIIIHANGQRYIFEVRSSDLVHSWETDSVLRHEEYNWLTLMTCENWVPEAGAYQYRRIVRAVLVQVEAE